MRRRAGDAGRDTAGWTRPTPGRRRVIGVGFGVCAAVALVLTLKPAAAPGRSRIALGPGAGQPAPALRLPDLQGRDTRLSAFRGRPVALVFLATWCEGCRDEMPALARAAPALTRRPRAHAPRPRHPRCGRRGRNARGRGSLRPRVPRPLSRPTRPIIRRHDRLRRRGPADHRRHRSRRPRGAAPRSGHPPAHPGAGRLRP